MKWSAVERGCYRSLDAWGGKKGNGLSDLCEWFSPVFKQQHESQACFWSPAQNVNCNLSHQPKDVVWKGSLESLHINDGTLWDLCTSYSSSLMAPHDSVGLYVQLKPLRNLEVLHWENKAWHIIMNIYIQEICASTRRELCFNFSNSVDSPFVQIKEINWSNLTGLFLRLFLRKYAWSPD